MLPQEKKGSKNKKEEITNSIAAIIKLPYEPITRERTMSPCRLLTYRRVNRESIVDTTNKIKFNDRKILTGNCRNLLRETTMNVLLIP